MKLLIKSLLILVIFMEIGVAKMRDIDRQLQEQIDELAFKDDIQGMTNLLLNWKDKKALWLIFVDSRLLAPSTTDKQKKMLQKVREESFKNDEKLANMDFTKMKSFDDIDESGYLKSNEDYKSEVKTQKKSLNYSKEEKKLQKIYEKLYGFEDYDDKDFKKFDDYLKQLNIINQPEFIQHRVNKMLYGLNLHYKTQKYIKEYMQTPTYKLWYKKYAPDSILTNKDFSFKDLKALINLENQKELLERKDYYAYQLKKNKTEEYGENKIKQTFDEFYEEFGYDYRFGSVSSVQEIDEFEQKYNVKFPHKLKTFYKKFGSFKNGGDRSISLMNVSEWNDSIKSADWGKPLKGIGLFDMLGYMWEYNHNYHLAGASNGYKANRHKIINENYIAVATVGVDDNSRIVVYFEKDKPNEGFGLVYDNQDYGVVFEDYLDVMLVSRGDDLGGVSKIIKPLTKYSLAQILGVLVMFIDTPGFNEDDFLKYFKGNLQWRKE